MTVCIMQCYQLQTSFNPLFTISASTESLDFLVKVGLDSSGTFLLMFLEKIEGLSSEVPTKRMLAAALRSLSTNCLDLFLRRPAQSEQHTI